MLMQKGQETATTNYIKNISQYMEAYANKEISNSPKDNSLIILKLIF